MKMRAFIETIKRTITTRTLPTLLFGLVLSLTLLLPKAAVASEIQPFFTLKASSINTFLNSAERIADLAGVSTDPGFLAMLNLVRNIQGFDFNGDIGVAAFTLDDGSLNAVFLLPIANLRTANIPSNPEVFDSIRPFLIPRGPDRTEIIMPAGAYVALQKEGYLVVAPESVIDQVPADAKSLFADLDQYILGMKLDLENVRFETLEANIFVPMMFVMAMQDPQMAQQFESVVDVYRQLYHECSMLSGGIAFNPQTADLELTYSFVPRTGSDAAKLVETYNHKPTSFNGFRGEPGKTVFSSGESVSWGKVNFENSPIMNASMKQYAEMFEGLLEQIDMDDETGQTGTLVRSIGNLIHKIYMTEAGRGTYEMAFSFDIDGITLWAFDTVSLAEMREIADLTAQFINMRFASQSAAAVGLIETNFAYTTVDGFELSSVNVPLVAVIESFSGTQDANVPAPLRALRLNVFLAVKKGDTQSVALAAGLDAAKTEQALKTALGQTATPRPLQGPQVKISIANLGQFLQQTVLPIVADAAAADPHMTESDLALFRKVAGVLASAGDEATIVGLDETKPGRMSNTFRVSGKAIQAVLSLVKIVIEEGAVLQ